MAETQQDGKTLWEMLRDRLHAGNGSGIPFYNPLDLRVGSAVPMAFANGPEYSKFSFTVGEIRQYIRRISGQEFDFTDYVLRGVDTATFDADHARIARLRAVPNAAGSHETILLGLFDEFQFAEDFLNVLKDKTGIFEVTDDASGAKESFSRINGLTESYEAAVMVIGQTAPDGKAVSGNSSSAKLEYWDYWRDMDIGGGNTAKEFVFVEMNSDTGWFQIWRGREYFS